MTSKVIKFFALTAILLCTSETATFGQAIPAEEFPLKSEEELREILRSAKSFFELEQTSNLINSMDRCGRFANDAAEALTNMRRIKANSEGNVTRAIQIEYEEQRGKNEVALFDYKSCFTRNLSGMREMMARGITTYEAHKAEFDRQATNYTNVPDMASYILAVEAALQRLVIAETQRDFDNSKRGIGRRPDDTIAIVKNVHRDVRVLPGGRGNDWKPVGVNYGLRLRDEIRTGPRGRVRFVLNDHYVDSSGRESGPTIINMNSNTHIKMERYAVSFNDPKKSESVLGLVKGALRAFTRNFGINHSVRVGGGNVTGGIRGTEASFEYDPNTDVFNMHVDHGDAFIEHNGQEISVAPKTSRTVAFGNLSPARPLTEEQWANIVANTGDGYAETAETSRLAALSLSEIDAEPRIAQPATPVNVDEEFRREMAKIYVRSFLESIRDYDENLYLSLAVGQIRNSYDISTQTKTFREFVDGRGERPLNWTHQCAVCLNDDKNTCQVQVYVDAVDPTQSKSLIFWYEESDDNSVGRAISKAALAQGDDLVRFQSLNPVCEVN